MTDDVKLTDVIKENDELQTLKALQVKVAKTLDSTTSARDIGMLAKQLREITERIALLDDGGHDEISEILDSMKAEGRAQSVRRKDNNYV